MKTDDQIKNMRNMRWRTKIQILISLSYSLHYVCVSLLGVDLDKVMFEYILRN